MTKEKPVAFNCPLCGRDFHFPAEYLKPGATVKCAHCNKGIMLSRQAVEDIKTKNALW